MPLLLICGGAVVGGRLGLRGGIGRGALGVLVGGSIGYVLAVLCLVCVAALTVLVLRRREQRS